LEIIDFGIGIPEEDKQKLFNTFYRASNAEELREPV
jgi:signal transduction histidine kinase